MGFRAVAFSLLAVSFHNLALLSGVQGSGPDAAGRWWVMGRSFHGGARWGC